MHDPRLASPEPTLLLVDVLDTAHYSWNPAALPYLLVAAGILATTLFVWHRDPDTRVSRLHAGFSLMFVLWALGRGLLRLADDPTVVVMLARMFYVLVSLAIPLLFSFSCVLTRNETRRAHLIRFNWCAGVILAFLSITTPWLIASWQEMPWGMEPWHGILGMPYLIWIGLLLALVLFDIGRALRDAPAHSSERSRLRWYGVAVGILGLAGSDLLLASGIPVLPIAALPVLAFSIITAWIHHRYGLVEVTTKLAADKMAALIQHALVIMDAEATVQVVNQRTARLVGLPVDQIVGRPAHESFGDAFLPDNIERLAQDDHADVEKEFIRRPRGGSAARDLSASFVSIRDGRQRVVAFLSLVRDVTAERKRQQARLAEGLRDNLTQLPNRSMFLGLLDAAVKQARGSQDHGFATCLIGLDRLRVINEDLGYAAGDQVISATADRLRRVLSASDTVARVGGDEFALLMTLDADPKQLDRQLEVITDTLRRPLKLDDHEVFPSASIGVASSALNFNSGSDALRSASIAMFKVKESGGGDIRWISADDMGGQRTRLEAELRRAIDERQFEVHYQPVVSFKAGDVVGFEALVRWRHPEKGLLGPVEFIEYAEQSGLIAAIDRQVLEQACIDLVGFRRHAGFERLSVSVNMAEEELRPEDFAQRVSALVAENGLPNQAVRLELLERVALTGQVRKTLAQLQRAGIDVCIDDFGTGFSSLSRLHELPISVLKIDRSFVKAMALGEGGEKIISSILALADNLELAVVAEGAGTEREARQLHDLGCDVIQGFYFARPMPADRVHAMLREPAAIRQRMAVIADPAS